MIIEQMYTGCLSHAAYYLESDGEAAVVDPLRDIDAYIVRANTSHAKIKFVLETHFHADFVSGHMDLKNKTGAIIVYGPTAKPGFQACVAADGQEFNLGKSVIKVISTPGHTLESVCFLIRDEAGKETALFTGDTLFIGDVGRPDLAQKIDPSLTKEKLASLLYDSLHERILPLADSIVVYPGHGAGSACGKHLGPDNTDTLGHQKLENYGLKIDMDRQTFIRSLLEDLEEPPAYFPSNVTLNKSKPARIEVVINRSLRGWAPNTFERIANVADALVIDTRNREAFKSIFIPNSINIGIDGNFAPWLGRLVKDVRQAILFVSDTGKEREVVTRMARIGFDNCRGYLEGGIDSWLKGGKEIDSIGSISARDLDEVMKDGHVNIIDVRRTEEFEREHVAGALSIPLEEIDSKMRLLNQSKKYYIYCHTGFRSSMFSSILKSRGFMNITDVQGGFNALKRLKNPEAINYLKRSFLL